MKKNIFIGIIAGLFVYVLMFAFTSASKAETIPAIDFESPTYTLGNVNGQDGWAFTGPYDVAVSSSLGTAGFGSQSFRISNAVTSGSFGDWAFSKPLANEAGETAAANDGLSGGTRQAHFEAQFQIASTVPGAQQPGLQFSFAPDRGDGARMSYLRFEDQSDNIHVLFNDYQDLTPFGGAVGDPNGCDGSDNFFETDVATLNRSTPHTVKLTMDFVDGPRNDVVKVFIDGVLVKTGTSWEDYFRYCEGNPTRTVDSLIFQARSGSGTAPTTLGYGYLIDSLNLSSGPIPTPAPVKQDVCHKEGKKSTYHLINVSINAVPAHLAHGDKTPGVDLSSDCSPLSTFSATDSKYYNGADDTYPQYGSGPISFTWDSATGNVTGGYYTEQVPPNTGTLYYNIVTGGTVTGTTVHLVFDRTNPDVYHFTFDGTLVGNVLTGTMDGPYLFTATGI